jgi:hypothetical protein
MWFGWNCQLNNIQFTQKKWRLNVILIQYQIYPVIQYVTVQSVCFGWTWLTFKNTTVLANWSITVYFVHVQFSIVASLHCVSVGFVVYFILWHDSNIAMKLGIFIYTGLFISPSGISELDCATTKTDTAERSISIGRESLRVFFVLGALAYLQVPPLGGSRDEKWRECVLCRFLLQSLGTIFLCSAKKNGYLDMLQLYLMPQLQHVQVVKTGNSWLRKEKWSVDFARGNGTTHIHAIFRHDYPLAVEPASTPSP